MRPAVYAHGLTVEVGGHRLLDGAGLTVGAGDWVTVVGPNGAGKTTLLRALAGLVAAGGRVEIHGTAVHELRAARRARAVAYVPQIPVMPTGMALAAYVMLGRTASLRPLQRESRRDRDAVAEVLDQLELTGLAARDLTTLSGGERQRAAVARGLVQGAAVLLLDEPTSALDIGHQQDLLDHLDAIRRRQPLTVVSTMHDLTLAAQYADHLVVLRHGRVVLSGAPAQVLRDDELARAYGARVEVVVHRGHHVVIPVR